MAVIYGFAVILISGGLASQAKLATTGEPLFLIAGSSSLPGLVAVMLLLLILAFLFAGSRKSTNT